MLDNLYIGVLVAILSTIYINVISEERIMIWWFKIGFKYRNKLYYNPIWGCAKCNAGQIMFWIYLLNWLYSIVNNVTKNRIDFIFYIIPKFSFMDYSFIGLFIYVAFTIFIVFIINKKIFNL